jgi:NADH-quinone oxidoreductase subunit E
MGAENQSLQTVLGQFPAEAGSLIPILQSVQARAGYISSQAVCEIAQALRLTESQVYGVASFYAQFRFTPPARHGICVCLGTACHVRGGERLMQTLQRNLGAATGSSTSDGRFDLNRVACLGCCALSPVVKVDSDIYSSVTTMKLKGILSGYE